VLNVGSDIEMTILDLAQKVIAITNSKSQIIQLPALEEGDMTRRCPDTTKMKIILKRELISLEDGINKLVDFYENRK
jgi:UDP-glucose 4-epimerase